MMFADWSRLNYEAMIPTSRKLVLLLSTLIQADFSGLFMKHVQDFIHKI